MPQAESDAARPAGDAAATDTALPSEPGPAVTSPAEARTDGGPAAAVLELVRDLDGRVPVALICVDEQSTIHAVALPPGVPRPDLPFESRALESAFADVGGTLDASREQLEREGRARVRVALACDPEALVMDADVVRLSHLQQGATSPRSYEDLVRTIHAIAHDLQNPIASLRGFTRLLRTELGTALDSRSESYVASLESNIHKVQALIETLVKHCRIPERETRREFVPMQMVFAKLTLEYKELLDERGIELHLDPDPPPVYANPERLQQVVLQLVANATDHMGGVREPTIWVDVEDRPKETVLCVRDNGQGLPDDGQYSIRELFAAAGRLEAHRTTAPGLAIAQRIMRAHRGRIEYESVPSGGGVIRAYFPNP